LGRGYTDRPDITYNQACFDQQLADILYALGINAPVNLVGLSMGGAIAVGFADKHPELVNKLVLINPAGMPSKQSLLMRCITFRGVGEWLFDRFAEKLIVAALARDKYTRDKVPELEGKYRVQMQYRGFKRALLSTLRNGPIYAMAEAYERVGYHPRPVLLIWGKHDRTVPFKLSYKVRAALPKSEFLAVENAGHIPHYEQPESINRRLIRFLNNSDAVA
jgi:pimeloyl-ACP methyl ester carboxylesterase